MISATETQMMPSLAVLTETFCETSDTFSLTVAAQDDALWSFSPGQFNMVGIPGIGEAAFSISGSVNDGKSLVHTIKAIGNVSRALCRLGPGQTISIRGPYGTGWPVERVSGKDLVVIAGGLGLAPLRSVVHYFLSHNEQGRKLYLLYGARTEDDLLFKEELKAWSRADNISLLISLDQRSEHDSFGARTGFVTALIEELPLSLQDTPVFICGPEVMMRAVGRCLIGKGQDTGNMFVSMERRMKCGIAQCGHCQIGAKFVCKDGPVMAYADITRFFDNLL